MGKSKAHYRQLARVAEKAAIQAVNNGIASDEQRLLAESRPVTRDLVQKRLSSVRVETKGDRLQRCDRRDGIGMAPAVGAGNAENCGRLRSLTVTTQVNVSLLRETKIYPHLGNDLVLTEKRSYERFPVMRYQLIEINRDPYLRLISMGKNPHRLISLGQSGISLHSLAWLGSWLGSDSTVSLQNEWDVLIGRASEYR